MKTNEELLKAANETLRVLEHSFYANHSIIHRLNEAIANAEKAGDGWISITNPPEPYQDVLMSHDTDRWVNAGFINPSGRWYNDIDPNEEDEVFPTHFMPLPSPPQKEGEGK